MASKTARRLGLSGMVFSLIAGVAATAGRQFPAGAGPVPPPKTYETISLLGDKLSSPPPDKASLDRYADAKLKFAKDPSEENALWLGRRAAYAGRYREAIKIFSEGLRKFPESAKLLRHRGHRYLTLRQFQRAIGDLDKAAELMKGKPLEIESDGIPNEYGKPLSNTHYNIYYHLGLAHFLAGDYPAAEKGFRDGLAWSKNDDSVIAATDWLYLTLRRMRRDKDARDILAAIKPRMAVIENSGYYGRLFMYKGIVAPDAMLTPWDGETESERKPNFLIRAYGLGNWHLWGGDAFKAADLFETILKERAWSYFASIAAEVDLASLMLANPAHRTVADALKTWVVMWNLYDLTPAYSLFSVNPIPTYVSSERKGLIQGIDSLIEHYKGFGFEPGGKSQDSRLWLEDVRIQPISSLAVVTARWFFDKNVGEEVAVQQGPATFVFASGPDGVRIVHAHFADD